MTFRFNPELMVVSLAALLAVSWFIWSLNRNRTVNRDPSHSVVHSKDYPKCPDGYRYVADVFTEADGTKQSAYASIDVGQELTIDYLLPGESIEVPFILTLAPSLDPKENQ